jgi:hypothetical protein
MGQDAGRISFETCEGQERNGDAMTSVEIERIAEEIARRFDAVHMRTEDRLNDEYLKRIIREIAIETLTEATNEG